MLLLPVPLPRSIGCTTGFGHPEFRVPVAFDGFRSRRCRTGADSRKLTDEAAVVTPARRGPTRADLPFPGGSADLTVAPVSYDRRPRLCGSRNPPRRARTVGAGSATITELAEPFGMSLTGMKKHIRLLEEAELVTTEKVGRIRTMHARSVCIRGHQHVAAATRPLRAGRRTNERSTMSTTAKNKQHRQERQEAGGVHGGGEGRDEGARPRAEGGSAREQDERESAPCAPRSPR